MAQQSTFQQELDAAIERMQATPLPTFERIFIELVTPLSCSNLTPSQQKIVADTAADMDKIIADFEREGAAQHQACLSDLRKMREA